jgi:hypothetical protein
MADIQEIKDNNPKVRLTSAFKDLVTIGIATVFVLCLSYFFNVFILIIELFKKYPHAITWIDEIITAFLTLTIGFAIFSWRRWLELKKETAERIRIQKELTEIAETSAEVERIISKQLRSDMEHIKETQQEILRLLTYQHRGPIKKA